MTASFTSRSIFWRHSRNDSTRTGRPGVPCSPLPANRIGFNELGRLPSVGREFSNIEELQTIVGVRVAGRGASHQQSDRAGELVLLHPGPGKIAPALRIIEQL